MVYESIGNHIVVGGQLRKGQTWFLRRYNPGRHCDAGSVVYRCMRRSRMCWLVLTVAAGVEVLLECGRRRDRRR